MTDDEALLEARWHEEHSLQALREGWNLWQCGSLYGPWQVQKVDDPDPLPDGSMPAVLQTDDEAMRLVALGSEPHHIAAREFLKVASPQEFAIVRAFIESEGREGASESRG